VNYPDNHRYYRQGPGATVDEPADVGDLADVAEELDALPGLQEEVIVVDQEGDPVTDPDDDVVVAEIIEVDEVHHRRPEDATGQAADYDSGTDWHNIQATFVDDPQGAVQLAADAAESAVSALAGRVRDSRSAVMTATSDSPNQDTERLRFALQQYRQLGQTADGLVQAMRQG
jgi:hypothetical protein